MAITFDCPHCRKSLTTGDDKAGLTAKCPGCGQPIQVPDHSQEAAVDDVGEDATSAVDAEASPGRDQPGTLTCPMCGAENAITERRCRACGEPFPESRLRTGEPKTLELGRTMSLAWEIFKENLPVTVGAVFIIQICLVVWIYGAIVSVATLVAGIEDNEEVLFLVSAVAGLFAVISFLVMAFLGPGYAKVLLQAVRGEEYTFGTLFSCGKYFLPNLLATAIFAIAVGFGMAACVIPGILLSLMWWAYQFILIDDDVPAVASLARSKELMAGRWADVFLIGFIGSLLNGAIASTCCVAGVFSQAYFGLLMAVAYVKLRGENTVMERPGPRRSNTADVDDEAEDLDD